MVNAQPVAPDTPASNAYGLPPLPSLPCPEYRGPTPWSNWVIKGRLMAGAYPASLDDAETERILTTLLELGVNTFVCLQAEFSLHTPESAWRAGQGLRPYIKDAQRLLVRAREQRSHRIKQDKLDFLHLPIIDGSVTSDAALSRLADDCCTRLLRGERLYVHCWGGHGRTGTLIAVMLGRLYGITCAAALRFTQAFHDSRKFPQGVRSPQTTPQVAQVKRLLPDPPSARGVAYAKDPSLVLDDVILRPSSAPPGGAPDARPQMPVAAAAAAAVPAVAAPAGAAVASAGVADMMEVDEPALLPAVPLNQQRKEAIRAKQAGAGAGGGATPEAITAAMQAASLQSAGEALAGAAKGSSSSGGGGGGGIRVASHIPHEWLMSVLGKEARRPAAPGGAGGDAGGLLAAGPPGGPAAGAGYLQQHVQRQLLYQHQQPGLPLGSAPPGELTGKAVSSSGGRTIHLTATSGTAAAGAATHDLAHVDLRPSRVTVVAAPQEAERSASSMSRLVGYLSGRGGSGHSPR